MSYEAELDEIIENKEHEDEVKKEENDNKKIKKIIETHLQLEF